MLYHLLAQIVALLLDLITTAQHSERDKDLEILLLRQMERSAVLRILQRQQPHKPRASHWDKLALALLAAKLAASGHDSRDRLN